MAITIKVNNNHNVAYNMLADFEPALVRKDSCEDVFVGNLSDEQFGCVYCALARNGVNFDWHIHW